MMYTVTISQFFLQLVLVAHITLFTTGKVIPHSKSLQKRGISQEVFDNLDTFMKYASSAHTLGCASPLGNTLVATIYNNITSTQGFIARDDVNRLLVIAFSGTDSPEGYILDADVELVAFESQGVTAPGATVHHGFLTAYNSVASDIIETVRQQLRVAGPATGYSLRTTGHSLGGSLSSLAAVSLKFNFPNTPIQPRTGNPAYATLVNNMFGNNTFRSVHTVDGVPTIICRGWGYRHHAFEYWQTPDPASPDTIKMCDASGEDPTCSDSIPFTIPNLDAHGTYFNRPIDTSFCS